MLYITLLAESHDRLLHNLQELAFFRAEAVPSAIAYMSGFDILASEGLPGVLKLMRTESRSRKASLIVLDGLLALEESAPSSKEFRKFINDVEALAALMGCTILLLTSARYSPERPEYTMVDGWLELTNQVVDYRPVRELTVHKFRGSDFIGGSHPLRITDQGVSVLPRLESTNAQEYSASTEVITSGIEDLDGILGGGIPRASTTVVIGASGVGKTSFGLSFINECTPEDPGLIFGFYETPARLQRKAQELGQDLSERIESGAVEIIWNSPSDYVGEVLAYRILEAVDRRGVQRLMVDGLAGLRRGMVHPGRIGPFFSALSNELRLRNVTTLYTADAPNLLGGELQLSLPEQSAVAENIVLLRYMGLRTKLHRALLVVKARDQQFDPSVFEFSIGKRGIRLGRSLADQSEGHPGEDDPDSPQY